MDCRREAEWGSKGTVIAQIYNGWKVGESHDQRHTDETWYMNEVL